MIIKFNRFAFKPTQCDKCGGYIWLERYKRKEEWNLFTGKTTQVTCKRCVESEEK